MKAPQPAATEQRPNRIPKPPLIDRFHLLIECRDEAHQRLLYQKLTRQGIVCKPLLL